MEQKETACAGSVREEVREMDRTFEAMQRASTYEAYEAKIKDAAYQILEVSERLHLTWAEFECAVEKVIPAPSRSRRSRK